MIPLLLALVVTPAAGQARPASAPPPVSAEARAEPRATLEAIAARRGVPGLTFGFVSGTPSDPAVGSVGVADLASRAPVTRDTVFRVASMSKSWLALSLLTLEGEGRLSLSSRVAELLPDLVFDNPWEATHPLRVVHLLESTTGWDELSPRAFAWDEPAPASVADALRETRSSRVSRWPPGARYAYNNAAPAVSAAIVERLTGRPYDDYVAEAFFRPLGLASATLLPPPRGPGGERDERWARAYHAGTAREVPYWNMLVRPAAALSLSGGDLGRVLRFFVARGEGRLPAGALARMERSGGPGAAAGLATTYGLHTQALQDQGLTWRGHRGGITGASAELFYVPDAGVGYFCALNSDDDDALDELGRALRAHLAQRLPERAAAPPAPALGEEVEPFLGWYEPVSLRYEREHARAYLLDLAPLGAVDGRLRLGGRAGTHGDYMPVSRAHRPLFRRPSEHEPTLSLVTEGAERLVVTPAGTLRRLPTWQAWLRLGGLGLAVAAMGSAVARAAVLALRRLLRRGGRRAGGALHVWPALATATLAAGVALEAYGEPARLGRPTAWALALTVCSVLLPTLSLATLVSVVASRARGRGARPSRAARVHAGLVALALVGVSLYLAAWGLVGVRTWR
ncbi:MAG TPA: serine hydrolase domain-containing protein [Polyangiaceae bacterium]|nr:serine hydrolase domain-containing protein [Polyangiaceae bacterium]